MCIQKQIDFGNDRSKRYTPSNKFQDTTKETLLANTRTDVEEDVSTFYDSKGIYLLPTDGIVNHDYMSVSYSEGILLSIFICFKV